MPKESQVAAQEGAASFNSEEMADTTAEFDNAFDSVGEDDNPDKDPEPIPDGDESSQAEAPKAEEKKEEPVETPAEEEPSTEEKKEEPKEESPAPAEEKKEEPKEEPSSDDKAPPAEDKKEEIKEEKTLSIAEKIKAAAVALKEKLPGKKEEPVELTEEEKLEEAKKLIAEHEKGSKTAEILTEEQLVSLLEANGMADDEFEMDGKSIKLTEAASTMPEMTQMALIMSKRISKVQITEMLSDGTFAKATDVKDVQDYIDSERLVNAIAKKHKDVRDILNDAEFHEWVDKQDQDIQDLYSSTKEEHGVLVIDAFKEFKAAEQKKLDDEKAEAENKKKDDVHEHTSRGSTGKKGTEKNTDKKEGGTLQDGFDLLED